ncbi:putative fungal-specific transcription factor [Exophiala viscosa]|uniref:putative fungal-specific transcription factor n=1 Tax=Exophiala viscosa TaxID=2486360 RepID=UPI00218DAE21|nr:putative fungal-specific transcription factor [Exophiala viscosa]
MTANFQLDEDQVNVSKPLRRERLRIPRACGYCRSKKVKCDGGRPVQSPSLFQGHMGLMCVISAACARCHEGQKTCTYTQDSFIDKQQSQRGAPNNRQPQLIRPVPRLRSNVDAQKAHSVETPLPIESSTRSNDSDHEQDQNLEQNPNSAHDHSPTYYTAHGQFADQVAAAIDARAGVVPATTSSLIPFINAPLFGEIDLDSPFSALDHAVYLPPQAQAGTLVDIYWGYVDPVEPILDRERSFNNYTAAFSRQGASFLGDRERARALLRPETILWKPGSPELVQCLIIMNRFLHCTNNPQKTWLTAGLALRICQSMYFHAPETSSRKERQLKHQVWATCVAMDRCISWSLGRASAPFLNILPNTPDSISFSGEDTDDFLRSAELHEIGNQIHLAQIQTQNSPGERLGLPRPYQQAEYHVTAVQLDHCLNRWEHGLPIDWKLESLQKVVDRTSRSRRYVLHVRPMLACFCAMRSDTATSSIPSLGDRLVREGARMCIEAAQNMTSLVIETLEPDKSIGLLPWWLRIYCLHIAGTHLLAAMFRSDLYTDSVLQSWNNTLSALRAHEHLSSYVQQCIRTFEMLSTRILDTRYPNTDGGHGNGDGPRTQGASDVLSDDIFADINFDFDGFLFGTSDQLETQLAG